MMKNQIRRKILLIDDDASLLITLSDFLSFEGYEVTTADCAEQGLEIMDSVEPDLVILDMSMPGIGGMGFLREVTDATGKPKYPVLVLTARANMAEFFAGMEVDGFIAKPCDPADLLMEVGRIVFLRSGEESSGDAEVILGGKVLIAEDDGARNKILAGAFEKAGFDVCTVNKGPDVLEKAIVEKPDVIVLKLVMSSMNGDAIAGVLKDMPNTKGIPIVLFDDSDVPVPETKYTDSGLGIKKFVRSNDADSIVDAVKAVLA
jgi:DNA-binding response OmpR family regulator